MVLDNLFLQFQADVIQNTILIAHHLKIITFVFVLYTNCIKIYE